MLLTLLHTILKEYKKLLHHYDVMRFIRKPLDVLNVTGFLNVDMTGFLKNTKCHWFLQTQVYQGLQQS